MALATLHQFQFYLDAGIGGSITDYSGAITKISTSLDVQAGEHWTFAGRDSNRSVGGKSHTIKITVRVETTATSLFGYLMGIAQSGTLATYNGTLTFRLGTPDFATTGSITATGECKVIGAGSPWMAEAGKGDIQTCEFTLGTDGTVTYAVA
jgi:hypothetical protein